MFESSSDFEVVFRKTTRWAWAFFIDIAVFILLVEGLWWWRAPFHGFWSLSDIRPLRYAFYGLAFAQIFIMKWAANKPLKKEDHEDKASALSRLQFSTFIVYGLCEVLVILGLLLFLFNGLRLDFYVFVGIASFYLVLYFPKRREWKEWLEYSRFE